MEMNERERGKGSLEEAVREAREELGSERLGRTGDGAGGRRKWTVIAVAGLCLLALVLVARSGLFSGHSDEEIRQDLIVLLEDTREELEVHREATGALPARLSHPGIEGLVTYRRTEEGYVLTAAAMGITLRLDQDGVLKEE